MESVCPSQKAVLQELHEKFPKRPFLSLGQTPFWDEPMKAGVLMRSRTIGSDRGFVAGVHDTDYFAKHPGQESGGGYVALAHNDTSTRDLWSAAGEFSSVFGSETVITRDQIQSAGVRWGKVLRERPSDLDRMTEAYGWRGVVFAGERPPVVADTPLNQAGPVLFSTFEWALDKTLTVVPRCESAAARQRADELRSVVCDALNAAESRTVADFYEALIPALFDFASGGNLDIQATRSSKLLRFNSETVGFKRFEFVDLFLRPETADMARRCYDDAVRGTETYTLDRFGSCAIPFDLVIPKIGRGTVRIGKRGLIIATPEPQFISLKQPIRSVADLSQVIERKFGPNCALIGKAVTLISMLSQEFVFVFHEGASRYVTRTRALHQNLQKNGVAIHASPVLRVRYSTWDALSHCHLWLQLPEIFQQPFGADELTSRSFSSRWMAVIEDQKELLNDISRHRRPIDFVRFLAHKYSQSWSETAEQYEELHAQMESLWQQIQEIKARKSEVLDKLKIEKRAIQEIQDKKGDHFRETIFEKIPTEADLKLREEFDQNILEHLRRARELKREWQSLQQEQDSIVQADEIQRAHALRRDLELELERKRLKLVRQAITTIHGLERSNNRPCSWWFPVLCQDGGWFRATTESAEYYLEPLN